MSSLYLFLSGFFFFPPKPSSATARRVDLYLRTDGGWSTADLQISLYRPATPFFSTLSLLSSLRNRAPRQGTGCAAVPEKPQGRGQRPGDGAFRRRFRGPRIRFLWRRVVLVFLSAAENVIVFAMMIFFFSVNTFKNGINDAPFFKVSPFSE